MTSLDGVVGPVTLVVSLAIKLVGEPDQIRRNYLRRSTFGLSPILYALSLFSYVLWTVHGALRHDWVLIGAQSAGVVTTLVILGQMTAYRSRPDTTPVVQPTE